MANILDRVQSKVNKGYAKVAAKLGVPCDWYRPSTSNNPIDDLINYQDTMFVMFADDAQFNLKKPRPYKDPQMFASFDRTHTQVGDYLIDQITNIAYFINSQESMTPTGVIRCNAVLTFYRPGDKDDTGLGYVSNGYGDNKRNIYGGNPNNLGDLLASNWPVSMLLGTKGERAQLNLPNEFRAPWMAVKLPSIPGVTLETNDLAVYGDRRFFISGIEQSELGLNMALDETTL